MVNAAEADVVGPAVAAEGPHALLGQILLVLQDKGALLRGLRLLQGGDQRVGHLPGHGRVLPLGKILPNLRYGHTLFLQGFQPQLHLPMDGPVGPQEAVGELRVVFEQGMAPP